MGEASPMNTLVTSTFIVLLAACAERGRPVSSSSNSLPSATIPDASTPAAFIPRLKDPSNRLAHDERVKLDAQLQEMANAGNNAAILIIPSLNGENIDTVAKATFADWHLGEKGILLVLAMAEHRYRIETGHVIESLLTDDLCGQILREKLRPHLAQGDVFGALQRGLDAIFTVLAGEPRTHPPGRAVMDDR